VLSTPMSLVEGVHFSDAPSHSRGSGLGRAAAANLFWTGGDGLQEVIDSPSPCGAHRHSVEVGGGGVPGAGPGPRSLWRRSVGGDCSSGPAAPLLAIPPPLGRWGRPGRSGGREWTARRTGLISTGPMAESAGLAFWRCLAGKPLPASLPPACWSGPGGPTAAPTASDAVDAFGRRQAAAQALAGGRSDSQ